MGRSDGAIDRQRSRGGNLHTPERRARWQHLPEPERGEATRYAEVRRGVVGNYRHRRLEALDGTLDLARAATAEEIPAFQVRLEGLGRRVMAAFRHGRRAGLQPVLEIRHDPFGNLVLDGKHVVGAAIELPGPEVIAVARTDQLDGDAKAVAHPLKGALEQRRYAELGSDLAHIALLAAEGE